MVEAETKERSRPACFYVETSFWSSEIIVFMKLKVDKLLSLHNIHSPSHFCCSVHVHYASLSSCSYDLFSYPNAILYTV